MRLSCLFRHHHYRHYHLFIFCCYETQNNSLGCCQTANARDLRQNLLEGTLPEAWSAMADATRTMYGPATAAASNHTINGSPTGERHSLMPCFGSMAPTEDRKRDGRGCDYGACLFWLALLSLLCRNLGKNKLIGTLPPSWSELELLTTM